MATEIPNASLHGNGAEVIDVKIADASKTPETKKDAASSSSQQEEMETAAAGPRPSNTRKISS